MSVVWDGVDATAAERLSAYRDLILEWNRRFNLTALRDADAVDRRLIAESLRLLPFIPENSPIHALDLGTGAGIPGIPLAIARPEVQFTLVDATGKKIRFVELVAETLGLGNVTAIHGRSETIAHDPAFREQYDLVVARAVTHLAALAELTLPFLRIGGRALLPKGNDIENELQQASVAVESVGGRLASADPLPPVPGCGVTRLVILDKIDPSFVRYPRRAGIPEHDPLGG